MSNSDIPTWAQFFRDASIPAQFANLYATKFCENRIRFDMLIDLDRALLNEMGISAIGDCLSILKHAKTINARVEEVKKESLYAKTNNTESQHNLQAKKNSEIVKRTIEAYSHSSDAKQVNNEPPSSSTSTTATTKVIANKSKQKSPLPTPTPSVPAKTLSNPSTISTSTTSSTLSQNLSSRLNFSQTQPSLSLSPSNTGNLLIKFNNDSIQTNPQAKIVSSTTEDNDDDDDEVESSRLKNLKRRINKVYDNDSVDSDGEIATRGKIISLKSTRVASLNEDTKLVKPFKTGLVINSGTNDGKTGSNRIISSNADTLRIEVNNQGEKKSVFNRIRSATMEEMPVSQKFPTQSKVVEKPIRTSTSFNKPIFQNKLNTKTVVKGLNKTLPSSASASSHSSKKNLLNSKMIPKLQMDFVNKPNTKNLHDRIQFA